MDSHLMIFFTIEIINLVVALGCFIYGKIRRNTDAVYKLLIMIMCPVLGPLFYFFELIFRKAFFSEPVDLAGVVFGKEKVKGTFLAQEDKESNLVSMEEAIAVTNSKDLRNLMMNVVQGDVKNSLHSISLALNSEDSETSHYAASVLQDELNEFRVTVENYGKKIEEAGKKAAEEAERAKEAAEKRAAEKKNAEKKDRYTEEGDTQENVQTASAYSEEQIYNLKSVIEYMDPFLEQRVFSDIEQISFINIMEEFCEKLYEGGAWLLSSEVYEAICMRLLEIEEYDRCEKWCIRGRQQYPDILSSFTCELKLYFNRGDKEKFFETVADLKKSSVVLDRETLEFIRVFV